MQKLPPVFNEGLLNCTVNSNILNRKYSKTNFSLMEQNSDSLNRIPGVCKWPDYATSCEISIRTGMVENSGTG